MSAVVLPARTRGLALTFGWRRIAFTMAFATAIGLLMGIGWKSGLLSILERTIALGLIAMLVFGLFEQWPKRLPRWLAPLGAAGRGRRGRDADLDVHHLPYSRPQKARRHSGKCRDRMEGFSVLCGISLFLAPWVALGALVRQKGILCAAAGARLRP